MTSGEWIAISFLMNRARADFQMAKFKCHACSFLAADIPRACVGFPRLRSPQSAERALPPKRTERRNGAYVFMRALCESSAACEGSSLTARSTAVS